jgi:GT2 family glycosyltransferase
MRELTAENPIRLFAVVVLFQREPADSEAVQSLQQGLGHSYPENLKLSILLYDNTPGNRNPCPMPEGMLYKSTGQNDGLSMAYNYALNLARLQGASWLLLLDQDTAMPLDFLDSVYEQIMQHDANTTVAALVPVVRSEDVIVSPKQVGFFAPKPLPHPTRGVRDSEIVSINSGTVVRCEFIRSIGGFNRAYWLDYLDHWLFHQIYRAGKKVAISDCVLEHKLAVQNYRQNIGATRYRSILAGEAAFMTTYKSKLQVVAYLVRLAFRAIRLAFHKQPDLALSTIAMIVRIAMRPMRSLEEKPQ